MVSPSEEWWARARIARDKLASQVMNHPSVAMVDLGKDDKGESNTPVLRVHVRQGDVSDLYVPIEVDDIPVRVIRGDYRLET